ncbi:dihydrolipoyl dehydrogenase [Paraburkholderia sp.]|uniref:dihydrolipoyl dehydrogenase n=1 Tax=Paraburkholderia sp. TaxID=1926495 RepID=UPI00238E3C50|nr:dihydrolipoyl dehydrogenase [Paraburkholderia sp.]MDE1180138.1 dihydrolipoyl dehydrogenase [Paraburkholderia sp.]
MTSHSTSLDVDVAIIGAGTSGMAAYRAARAQGAHAILLDPGPLGTTCARVGCMPSKLLLAAAHTLHDARQLKERGVEGTSQLAANWHHVLEYVRKERDHFVSGVLKALSAFPKDALIEARATFAEFSAHAQPASQTTRHTLLTDDNRQIHARSVVIATGATPAMPEQFRVFGDCAFTSDALFELDTLPARLAVFGAGPIALELGQGLARLGVQVFMFGKDNDVGGLDDVTVRDTLADCLSKEFYFDPDATIDGMSLDNGVPTIAFRTPDGTPRRESFDAVLVATGRKPDLKPLALEHAKIELDDTGTPRFDPSSMQCGDSGIFIAGDCDGSRPWLSDANDEGKIAGDNAARFAAGDEIVHVERKVPFAVVFCEPQVAMIGARYSELGSQTIVTGTVSFADQGRSRVKGQPHGLLHVYVDASDGRLLGAELCSPDAEHLGHLLAWSVQLGLTVDVMLGLPFYHPVVEEGLRTALRDANRKRHAMRGESSDTLSDAAGC